MVSGSAQAQRLAHLEALLLVDLEHFGTSLSQSLAKSPEETVGLSASPGLEGAVESSENVSRVPC